MNRLGPLGLFAALALAACSSGGAGPAGPTGPTGATGPKGDTGLSGVSVAATGLPPGHEVCVMGGTMFVSASGTSYACNGASVSALSLAPGADPACPAGGTKFTTGTSVTYACSAPGTGPCMPGRSLCGSSCVDLANDPLNCGSCAFACESRACANGACGKLVFITSQAFTGDLGGVAGADAKCQTAAAAVGLRGTFKAWLADTLGNTPPKTFSRSAGPYVNMNGLTVAANWSALIDPNSGPTSAIWLDETGGAAQHLVWTGIDSLGSPTIPYNCNNWTSSSAADQSYTGAGSSTGSAWLHYSGDYCNKQYSIYCFEQ